MKDKALTGSEIVSIENTGGVTIKADHTIYNSDPWSTFRSYRSFDTEGDNVVVRNPDNIVCDTFSIIDADKYYDIVATIENNAARFKDISLAEQCLMLERIDDTSVIMSIHLIKKRLTLENDKLRAISGDYLKKHPMIREYVKRRYPAFTFDNSEPRSTFGKQYMSPPDGVLFYQDYNFLYPSVFTSKGTI